MTKGTVCPKLIIMKSTENEITIIKHSIAEMWSMVETQVRKSFEALMTSNADLAGEVISREKMVNATELSIDRECENFIALMNPVAIDLRFVLSLLKINNNLERIGDFAESIAFMVTHSHIGKMDDQLVKNLKLREMFDEAINMLTLARTALSKEDSVLASKVLAKDNVIDKINRESTEVIAKYIAEHPEKTREMLFIANLVRKIERIGDRCSNIAEDIVFYIDAKELRHTELTK